MQLLTALRLGRVSNLPTTWTNVAAGLVLAGGAAPSAGVAFGLCTAISCLYLGGMYLNDAFDRDYDAKERPERPIPSGEVSAKTVFAIGYGSLWLGAAIVAAMAGAGERGAAPVLAVAALASVIVFYDAYHKQNPLSPLVMAVNRVLVYATAGLYASAAPGRALWFGCGSLFCYLVGLTYAAKQENLREPKRLWPLFVLALPFANPFGFGTTAGRVLEFAAAAFTAYSVSFLANPRRRNPKRAVSYLIAGISLLDAALVAGQGELSIAALCVAGFAATLTFQRVVPGT